MRVATILISLVVGVLYVASIARSTSTVTRDSFLGISPEDAKYYRSSSEIKCKDGSKKFTIAQLNDDFCDCPDGTDEPGTSACPKAKFYCRNAGHVSKFLFSSRVNDGICDCCDGSDEYDGKVKCESTCWEAGKVARDKLNKKIATYKEGVILRKQEIEQANAALRKDEAELTKLKSEEKILKSLVQQLKDRKEQIEKAEEKERLQKEKEDKEKKEAEEATKNENGEASKNYEKEGSVDDDMIGVLDGSSSDQDIAENHDENQGFPDNVADEHVVENRGNSHSSDVQDDSSDLSRTDLIAENDEIADKFMKVHATENKDESLTSRSKDDSTILSKAVQEADEVMEMLDGGVAENAEGLSKEELGRLVASRWTGGKTEEQTREAENAGNSNHDAHEEIPKDSHDQEDDGYATDSDDDATKYDNEVEDDVDETYEEEDNDHSTSSYKSDVDDEVDLSDITTSHPTWLKRIQQKVRSILQAVNLFQTPIDKSEAAQVRKEYDESSAKLSKMQARISSLTEKLKHDFGLEKEFYSLYGRCFEVKQNKYVYKVCPFKQASQVEGHSTTRLGSWEKFDDSYHLMIFSNGEKCWNGPDRSMKVKLRCGLKNEVTDVDEPSRCEYMALLHTPALCVDDKLKELQQKLDLMNQDQPQKHDEL